MKNPEESAFPLSSEAYKQTGEIGGLTKREYFAAMAMQGLLSNSYLEQKRNGNPEINVCYKAVAIADKLLAELEKPQP